MYYISYDDNTHRASVVWQNNAMADSLAKQGADRALPLNTYNT